MLSLYNYLRLLFYSDWVISNYRSNFSISQTVINCLQLWDKWKYAQNYFIALKNKEKNLEISGVYSGV